MYRFEVTARDKGTPPKSGTTTVEVWLKNVNNKAPVMDPPTQVVRVKEDAAQGLVIHIIQAYDPDGDGITFAFASMDSLVIFVFL